MAVMLRRQSSKSSISSGAGMSFPNSLDYTAEDANAQSQQSLGDDEVMRGMTGLLAVNADEATAGQMVRRSSRNAVLKDKNPPPAPAVVVEGLFVQDTSGAVYAPQRFVFIYSSNKASQEKAVDVALTKAIAQMSRTPDCSATRFKLVSPADYSGFLPTVVSGLSAKYKSKVGLPVADPQADTGNDEQKNGRKRRKT